jgi:hypothetical protein
MTVFIATRETTTPSAFIGARLVASMPSPLHHDMAANAVKTCLCGPNHCSIAFTPSPLGNSNVDELSNRAKASTNLVAYLPCSIPLSNVASASAMPTETFVGLPTYAGTPYDARAWPTIGLVSARRANGRPQLRTRHR